MKNNKFKNIGIITGIGKGIGFALCSNFLKNNYKIHALNRTSNKEIIALKKKYSENFYFYKIDITNYASVKKVIKKISRVEKNIDFLVNNAGVRSRVSLDQLNEKEIKRVIYTNLISHINITKEFLSYKNKEQKSIVMISSIVGNLGFKDLSSYASSKGALEAFSKSIAIEYAKKKVRINCIAPGFIKTSYFNNFKKKRKKLYDWTITRIPMGRWGEPDEIYPMVEFLISDKSSYVTGSTFYIDGGWTSG